MSDDTGASRARKRPGLRRAFWPALRSGVTHSELTRNPRGILISVANDGGRRNQQPSYQDCGMNHDTGASVAAGSAAYQKAVAFAQCMRSHGEPGWPDPNSQGNFLINGRKDHLNGGSQMQSATRPASTWTRALR